MKKKWFKNKTQMIIYLIIFALFILGFIYLGTKDYNLDKVSDSEKFYSEHSLVAKNNVYRYLNASEAYGYLKNNDNAILLIGITNSKWVDYYANILNEVAQDLGISQVSYYDITTDRQNGNGVYESLVKYLENYVTYLDNNKAELYGPTLIVKKNGNIIYFDDETALVKGKLSPEEYWTNYELNLKKTTLNVVLNDYLESNDGE